MTDAISFNDNSRAKIGEIIRGLSIAADATNGKDVKELSTSELATAEAAIQANLAIKKDLEFVSDPSVNDKVVVVPHEEILAAELGKLSVGEPYPLDVEYLRQSAKLLLDKMGSNASDALIAARVRELAAEAIAADDFLIYRLGEYCISQCR